MENILQNATNELQEKTSLESTLARINEINARVDQDTLPEGFQVDDEGVWWVRMGKNDTLERIWVCSPLWVTACVRDHRNENHGRVLEFQDVDGCPHQWVMPMELLAAEGSQVVGVLLNMGLRIAPKRQGRDRLLEYIAHCSPVRRARCVLQSGGCNKAFVLPARTIGYIQGERIMYQGIAAEEKLDTAGTLAEWQIGVASKACHNSRLLLAISSGFTGPLLALMNHENIGVHFKGHSSLGKSTAMAVAHSVWGSSAGVHTFRATANGLEGIASLHNDRLLCLDELGQILPMEAGQVVYMLGNGQGKGRANQSGLAKKSAAWRLVFLSTGEMSLAQVMNEAGKKVKAGQEVRLIEISADTGVFGLFEELHGCFGGANLADDLRDTCKRFYGTAAISFLEHLVRDLEGAVETVKAILSGIRQRYKPQEASSQVLRVFEHFVLIAAAGELASRFGVTGWTVEEAIHGVMKCFQDWLTARGDLGMHEESEALEQVRHFFECHGESKFSPWQRDLDDKSRTSHRMGFRRKTDKGTEFYVFPKAFRDEVCKGLDYRYVQRLLLEHHLLMPSCKGEPTRPERLNGPMTERCYRFYPGIFAGTDAMNTNEGVFYE